MSNKATWGHPVQVWDVTCEDNTEWYKLVYANGETELVVQFQECAWGATPPYTNACDEVVNPHRGPDTYCDKHQAHVDQFEALAASMPDDLDEVSVDDDPALKLLDPSDDPDYIAYQQARADEEFAAAYAEWKAEMLADDPDLTDDDVSEEAYVNELVSRAEARDEERWERR